jgi:hypothetical protein
MRCSSHPQIETLISCGKCNKPICNKCLVETPVGLRCRNCAGLRRLPTYQVGGNIYLRAVGVGLGIAIGCGVVWSLFQVFMPFRYLNLLIAPAAGYLIGEIISLAVNRKRGIGLAVIGGAAFGLSYFISQATFFGFSLGLFDVAALILGIFVSTSRLR